jgi:tellurite resistance protein TehA-like permease
MSTFEDYPVARMVSGTFVSVSSAMVGSLPQVDEVTHLIASILSALCSVITLLLAVVAFTKWIRKKSKINTVDKN